MFTKIRRNLDRSNRRFPTGSIYIPLCILFIVYASYIIAYKRISDDKAKPVYDAIAWKTPVIFKNSTAATSLYQEVRILCLVLRNKDNRHEHIQYTWGKRCNKLVVLESNQYRKFDKDSDFTEDKGKSGDVWPDVKNAFQYIYDNHLNDADWFLKANDETYVIMENLRYYLHSYQSESPLYFMYEPFEPQERLSSESVYVLNKKALKTFIESAVKSSETCQDQHLVDEASQVASCLDSTGVVAVDTRNSHGISAFFPHYLHALDVIKSYKPNWRNIRRRYSELCCPEHPIFYQQLSIEEMHLVDFAVYRLKIYGTSVPIENQIL